MGQYHPGITHTVLDFFFPFDISEAVALCWSPFSQSNGQNQTGANEQSRPKFLVVNLSSIPACPSALVEVMGANLQGLIGQGLQAHCLHMN